MKDFMLWSVFTLLLFGTTAALANSAEGEVGVATLRSVKTGQKCEPTDAGTVHNECKCVSDPTRKCSDCETFTIVLPDGSEQTWSIKCLSNKNLHYCSSTSEPENWCTYTNAQATCGGGSIHPNATCAGQGTPTQCSKYDCQ